MGPNNINMTVAANIQALMRQRGIDRANLAKAANLGPTGVYDIISGKSQSPKIVTIAKIADALGVPVNALFADQPLDDLQAQLYEILMSLDPAGRQRLLLTGQAWVSET